VPLANELNEPPAVAMSDSKIDILVDIRSKPKVHCNKAFKKSGVSACLHTGVISSEIQSSAKTCQNFP
jgi:hypothetical protein